MASRTSGETGFTLLELLAAIVAFGLVVLLLSQGFTFGVRASRLTAAEHEGDMLAIDRSLRHLVAFADPGIYPEPATLQGTAVTLRLTTELPGACAAAGPLQRGDAIISVDRGRLVLRWRLHRHVEWFGPGPEWQETVMSEGIERVEFAYFPPAPSAGWSPVWAGDRLPALVRMTVISADHHGIPWPPIIAAPLREPIDE